jgi:acid stress chaperone HdeB
MKRLTLAMLAASAALIAAKPALAAEAVDVSQLSCKQFSQYDDNNKGLIMMWFEGYYTEEDEPATIDFGKMAGHLAQILIECEANPDKSVLEVSEDAMDD